MKQNYNISGKISKETTEKNFTFFFTLDIIEHPRNTILKILTLGNSKIMYFTISHRTKIV